MTCPPRGETANLTTPSAFGGHPSREGNNHGLAVVDVFRHIPTGGTKLSNAAYLTAQAIAGMAEKHQCSRYETRKILATALEAFPELAEAPKNHPEAAP